MRLADGPFDRLRAGSTGLEAQTASLKNIPRTGLQNCRSLGCARDDKGKDGAFIEHPVAVERTAGPSTSLRFGRDDNSYLGTGCEYPRKIVIRK
jgi:hypothetical protein